MSLASSSLTHEWIWRAIDALARHKQLTASGLARLAGLDATTFNRSKRFTADGRPRWPSTESIAKILTATGVSLDEFITLPDRQSGPAVTKHVAMDPGSIPLIGEIADEVLRPWEEDKAAEVEAAAVAPTQQGQPFAIEVADSSLEPIYRRGLTLVATSGVLVAPGDRVLVKPRTGRAQTRLLVGETRERLELSSLRSKDDRFDIARDDVVWLARIIWASQ